MRAGLGLLSILIAAAIIFYISFGGPNGGVEGNALHKGKEMREQGNQITGHDENGVPVSESIKLDEVDVDGQFRRLKVVSVVPGGPFDTAYKLRAGDEITEIAGINVRDNNDASLAESQVVESYQRNQALTVMRGEQKLTLTPDSPLAHFNPGEFAKPTTPAIPMH